MRKFDNPPLNSPYGVPAFFALFSFLACGVSANPIAVDLGYFGFFPAGEPSVIPLSIGVALLALILEFAFLWGIFRAEENITWGELAWAFIKIHLITFPLTQFAAQGLGFFAEVFPVILEYLYYKKVFGTKLSEGRLFLGSLTANAASFIFGAIVFNLVMWKLVYKPVSFLKSAPSILQK